ncbi:hypothetical protein HUJ04_001806 [Dendroctonus ponderosae]
MRICWRALIGYGFVFWAILCLMDLIGITHVHKYSKELDELYEKPVVVKKIEQQLEPHLAKGIRFGWSLLLWNTVTFVISIVICSIGRNVAWMLWSLYRLYRNKLVCSQLNQYTRNPGSVSRIPIMVKSARSSETNFSKPEPRSRIDVDKSCPNLLMQRSGSNRSSATDLTTKTCRTLFRKDIYLCERPELSIEQQLEIQCKRLREELHRLQTTSLKEHAVLSRKLESVNKEKKELVKQLALTQKENRAAKQQLEELLQEKTALVIKLENATKEFKCNTKTKKVALAKLEEVTNNVEDLRQQLEQVTRDKEILDKKLKLLEIEYNKMHERFIASQQKLYDRSNNEHLPERDTDNEKHYYMETFSFGELDSTIPPDIQQTAGVLASMSQTELDMRTIQEKIKQLEKNLEKLNVSSSLEFSGSLDQLESELSLSTIDNTTDSQHKLDESNTTFSELSDSNSPKQKFWTEKTTELVGKNKTQFAKIQALASKMQDKVSFLGNIKEKAETIRELDTTDSEGIEPKRLVSSSVAFKNFLKSLNKLDAVKKEHPTKPEVYF